MRALLAVWHRKASQDVPEELLVKLMGKLGSVLPSYRLPPADAGHTRHYMPLGKLNKNTGQEQTSKIFDTFLHLRADGDTQPTLHVTWPAELTTDELEALEILVSGMGFLGRAESWTAARIVGDLTEPNAMPLEAQEAASSESSLNTGQSTTRLLSSLPSTTLASWSAEERLRREASLMGQKVEAAVLKGKDPSKVKLSKKDREKIVQEVPASVIEVLEQDTNVLRKDGWSMMPGTQWVTYSVPKDPAPVPKRKPRHQMSCPTFARFELHGAVLPQLTQTIRVANQMHRSLVLWSESSPVFTGYSGANPAEGHQHAFILPESADRDGLITHVNVFASAGFDAKSVFALRGMRKLSGVGPKDIKVGLVGMGELKEFADGSQRSLPMLQTARRWRSYTPFVPTRHPKVTRAGKPKLDAETHLQLGSPEHDLLRLLRLQGHPGAIILQKPTDDLRRAGLRLAGRTIPWLKFDVLRPQAKRSNADKNHGGRRGSSRGYAFEIEFDEPVVGPIAVGYGAHFGLGVFCPVLA